MRDARRLVSAARSHLLAVVGVVVVGLLLVFPAFANGDDPAAAASALSALQVVPSVVDSSTGSADSAAGVVVSSTATDAIVATTSDGSTVTVPQDPSRGVTLDPSVGPPLTVGLPDAGTAADAQAVAPGIVVYPSASAAADVAVQVVPDADQGDPSASVAAPAAPSSDGTGAPSAGSDTATDAGSGADPTAVPAAGAQDAAGPAADVTAPPADPTGEPVRTLLSDRESGARTLADDPAPPADTAAADASPAPTPPDPAAAPTDPAAGGPPPAGNLGVGLRIMVVVNSADAPSDYRFPVTVPPGGKLEQYDGGFEILDGDGIVTAMISTPWAKDATGANVPVSYSLDGTTIAMHVDHAGAAYPVVADPKVADNGAAARAAAQRAAEARAAADRAAAARAAADRAAAEQRAAAQAKADAEARAAAAAARAAEQAKAKAKADAQAKAAAAREQQQAQEAKAAAAATAAAAAQAAARKPPIPIYCAPLTAIACGIAPDPNQIIPDQPAQDEWGDLFFVVPIGGPEEKVGALFKGVFERLFGKVIAQGAEKEAVRLTLRAVMDGAADVVGPALRALPAEQIVGLTANAASAKGRAWLVSTFLTAPEQIAYATAVKTTGDYKGMAPVWIGQAVHRAVARRLRALYGNAITYHTVGPDFFDVLAGEWVELKTVTQLKIVGPKYGSFWQGRPVKYVSYTFPAVGS